MPRYDYVVVGAGSAGATLAGRLSERAGTEVLLLEAGPDHPSAATPAGISGSNFFGVFGVPGRMWPDLLAVRAEGQAPVVYARGRGVGGSSAINAMLAIRGIPEDYDRWAVELGCPGWAWVDMLPLFLAVEDDVDYGGDGLHGKGGPIPLARVPHEERTGFDVALCEAAAALGHPVCDDYHAPGATGVSRCAQVLRDGRRVSTNDAYLEPARGRPNLTVRGGVLVDRVTLDGRRATGVLTAAGEQVDAGEVILSAGAIHSPAILLRSGIGPEIGLPVGANLIDHAATAGFEVALREHARAATPDRPVLNSLVRYSSGLPGTGANDMQLVWFTHTGTTTESLAGARIIGATMQVFSRGEVRLQSRDPLVDPVVEFRMLSDERDLVRMREVVARMVALVRHPAVAAVTESVRAGTAAIDDLGTDADIERWLWANVNDYVHAVGTCRMGTPGDPAAVVDPAGRVIGFEGLRVCDASVMPDVPRANTHLTAVAIAEGVARLLR